MAVVTISGVSHYAGLSSDVKPTGVTPGSVFWETSSPDASTERGHNAVTRYVFNGVNWEHAESFTAIEDGFAKLEAKLEAVINLLTQIAELQTEATLM